MQNRPVDTERRGKLQQLRWPRVAAAKIAMESGQGSRLAYAVTQSHEVDDGACRIVDANILAGSCLQSGQAKLEGRGLETKYLRGRERDLRRAACPGHGYLDGNWNLVSQIMHRGCRHQADDGRGVPVGHAGRSGKLAGAAPARRKTPRDSSTSAPVSRAL